MHIAYRMLGRSADLDYFALAFSIAERLGWIVYDDQSGEPISREQVINQQPAPKMSAERFRVTQVVFTITFSGAATWLFATSCMPVVAWILAVGAAFSLFDAIAGQRKSSD
ncbi:MAG: hypothetical protein MUF81_11705 [Verrucomicrobia bacterium]|jgi:hypothetical protein|nr:hypothetical protein [Verrucomicrobiota bacterium]